jgi:hypothetical protein
MVKGRGPYIASKTLLLLRLKTTFFPQKTTAKMPPSKRTCFPFYKSLEGKKKEFSDTLP